MDIDNDFWKMNKNILLRQSDSNVSRDRITVNRESQQSEESEESEDNHCRQFFSISHLVTYFGIFLTISTLNSLSAVNKRINALIRKSNILSLHHLRILIEPMLNLANNGYLDEDGNHFYRTVDKSVYVYEQNVNNCIKGVEHPFRLPPEFMEHKDCVRFKQAYVDANALRLNANRYATHKVDQPLHQLITGKELEIYHRTFNNNALSNSLKKLSSFSNTRISNCYVEKHGVKYFLENWKVIVDVPTTRKVEVIESQTWQKFNIGTLLHKNYARPRKNIVNVRCRSGNYFVHYWQKTFYLHKFVRFINWQNNLIMGGSVFQAVVALENDTIESPQSDLDVFAHNIPYDHWTFQLMMFESKVIEANIKLIKVSCNSKVMTYYLIFSGHKQIKIQFIFTCRSATAAQILSSFDISATQIAFDPHKFILLTTYGFLDFMKTGCAAIFDLTQIAPLIDMLNLRRIVKYIRRGVKSFKIPRGHDGSTFFKQLNKTQRQLNRHGMHFDDDILPIQIGLNPTDYLSSKMYSNPFTDRTCVRSNNHDETHVLRMFLNLLLNTRN